MCGGAGTWGRTQPCTEAALGRGRGRVNQSGACQQAVGRPSSSACGETPGTPRLPVAGTQPRDRFCFLLETASSAQSFPTPGCVGQPGSSSLLFLLFPPVCPLSFPSPPISSLVSLSLSSPHTSLFESADVGGILTHPWLPAVPHPPASAPPPADSAPSPAKAGPWQRGSESPAVRKQPRAGAV